MITLTPEQEKVKDGVLAWLSRRDAPYMAIAGYAGTGKTTTLGMLASELSSTQSELTVAYMAPTGKASLALREKLHAFGAHTASSSTIHSAIYKVTRDFHGRPVWTRNRSIAADLIVVDEASMVGGELFNDIMSFKKPVLFVGDSGQLPPVGEETFAPLVKTELRLNEVHRQALDNPILRIATDVRKGSLPPAGQSWGTVAHFSRKDKKAVDAIARFMGEAGNREAMILCGLNFTRVNVNRRVRVTRLAPEKPNPLPHPGEKLVCLRNSRESGLFNGQLVYAESSEPVKNSVCYRLRLADYSGPELYASSATLDRAKYDGAFVDEGVEYFDYGYCLSVHKAQGSEWARVLLYNEKFRNWSKADYHRWLYTGITRARERLLIVS